MSLYTYRCRVLRVVDGDTLDVAFDLGFSLQGVQRVRLLGVNTPELRGPSREAALAARAFAQAWVAAAPSGDWPLVARTEKADKYGRYLATLTRADTGESLADALLMASQGVPA